MSKITTEHPARSAYVYIRQSTADQLIARYRRLVAVGKKTVVVTTAIAREMIGFIWAIARQVQPQSS